jgi:hypothetical protein
VKKRMNRPTGRRLRARTLLVRERNWKRPFEGMDPPGAMVENEDDSYFFFGGWGIIHKD